MIEQRRDEVVVQPLDVERNDGESRNIAGPVEMNARVTAEARERATRERELVLEKHGRSHHVFEQEGDPRSQVAENRWGPTLFALVEAMHIVDLLGLDASHVVDGAASGALGPGAAEKR